MLSALNISKAGCVLAVIMLAVGLRTAASDSVSEVLAARGTKESVRRAIAWKPDRADLYRQIAFLDSAHSMENLRKASRIDSTDARSVMEYGLLLESQGYISEAEQTLLSARTRDKGFETSWTLASFYFRRHDPVDFRKWIATAATRTDDYSALMDLGWRADPSLHSLLAFVPETCAAHLQLLRYLENPPKPSALDSARLLTGCGDDASRQELLRFTDTQIFSGDPAAAAELWANMFHNEPPEQPRDLIFNGSFSRPVSRLGFDWHRDEMPGVTVGQRNEIAGGSFHFDLTGGQPDAGILLWQPLYVSAPGAYLLRFQAASSCSAASFRWTVATFDQRRLTNPVDSPAWNELGSSSRQREWKMNLPGPGLHALELIYARAVGESPCRGGLAIENVSMTPVSMDRRAVEIK